MKSPLRKYASAVVAAALAISLAACGSSTSSEPTKAPELKPGEVAKFTWLHRLPDKKGAKTVAELVEEFNAANPDIEVTPETMQGSANESYAKINSIVEAGKDVPCLTQIGYERVPDMLKSLLDVSQYTKQYEKDYIPAFYQKAQVGKSTFGFPQGASPLLMYYREDLYKEYGLELPKTWEEYQAQAKLVREKSGKKAYLGTFLTDEPMWLSGLTTSEGADWFGYNPDNQKWLVDIASPQTAKVAQYWQGLVDSDDVLPIARWGQDFSKFIADGTIISHIGAPWEAPLLADTVPQTSGKWRVAQIPHFDVSNKAVGQNGGTIIAVLKGCKYPEQAVKFAHWFTTNNDGLTGLGLLPPTNVDKLETPKLLADFFGGQPIYDEFITANKNAPVIHWAPALSDTFKAIGDAQGKVGKDGKVESIFTSGQETAVKSLKAVGLEVTTNK